MFWKKKSDAGYQFLVHELQKLHDQLVRAGADFRAHEARVDERLRRLEVRPAPPAARKSQVEDVLPIVDRLQELLLCQMGHPDLAQQFGSYSRQREQHEPDVQWEKSEPESGYDTSIPYGG